MEATFAKPVKFTNDPPSAVFLWILMGRDVSGLRQADTRALLASAFHPFRTFAAVLCAGLESIGRSPSFIENLAGVLETKQFAIDDHAGGILAVRD